MPLTRGEQTRLMAAAKAVVDKAVLIMQELGSGGTSIASAADMLLGLEQSDLPVLRRRIEQAGEKTNWGIA